jgi:iron complex outermembrane receptor protein
MSLHPFTNGFQAVLGSQIYDFSYAGKYNVNDWLVDLSNTFGSNTFNYNVSNTNNASLGAKSPTRFYAGLIAFCKIQ